MPATVTINGRSAQTAAVASLFDIAASVGVQVPTSCRKQGKCKECIVEISEGAQVLSERTEAERHLRGNFRLSCQASVTGERTHPLPYHAPRPHAD